MKKYLQNYVSDFERDLNIPIMNKEYDEPLVNYVVDTFKSLEVLSTIKITGYDYTEKESEIDVNKYIFKREKWKKKKERYDYKYVNDTRCGKLTIYAEITLKELDGEGKRFIHKYPMKKVILIPLKDEKTGEFYIKGKPYYMIYQIVEKSTYTSRDSVVLKSLMPVAVRRGVIEKDEAMMNNLTNEALKALGKDCVDVVGKEYTLPVYHVLVLRKEVPAILFYLSKGIDYCLNFLGLNNIITFKNKIDENDKYEDYIYFHISNKCYLRVIRDLFDKYTYIQSVVGGLLQVTTNRTTIESLNDPKIWIKKIANPNNYDKGKDILKFFNRLCDETTKKILKTHPYHKRNIYTILRWIMMEFNELRMKDNLDLNTKRLRDENEYISSLLTKELSRRLNRILSLGEKATIDNYRELFKFPGDLIIQRINSSGILRFNDNVNDMSFFSKFKYTNKGPHALGSKNTNNIGIRYRGIHPSYLGNIDILVCGNSDPGTSGMLSPFNKMKSFYFDDSPEKDDNLYLIEKELQEKYSEKKEDFVYIGPCIDSKEKFYDTMQKMEELCEECKAIGVGKDGSMNVVTEEQADMDEESTITMPKKKKKKKKEEDK